jgi:DNA-binding response OmpR family regulator
MFKKNGSKTVLMAEDDDFLSGIYKQKFEMEGLKVVMLRDGEKVLKEAQKKLPDIILLDILLPKKDGFTVLGELKSNQTTKNIPVIILTNLGQKENVQHGIEMGAKDYLIKSHFRPTEVIEKIKKILKI